MEVKTTLSVSEARKQIFKILQEVEEYGRRYILTEKGRPKAVLLSAEEFESWLETLEVAKDFPGLIKDIRDTERDIKAGKHKNYKRLEQVLEDKKNGANSVKRHGISAAIKTKSHKRAAKAS